jgi:uracil-DNA glycosylase
VINVHPSWQKIIQKCYDKLDIGYKDFLEKDVEYFPNYDNFLNAFKTLPLDKTRYILFGQDPYPREKSAIGYAFIDGMVDEIFCANGLSKRVNRATSLRNFTKMLLVASGHLDKNETTKEKIAVLDKSNFIDDIMQLKSNFEKNGVLLLNTSLIFTDKKNTVLHVRAFMPFIEELLKSLSDFDIELILFGNIAKDMEKRFSSMSNFKVFKTMHPYNVGFIKDSSVIEFFKPMNLLSID